MLLKSVFSYGSYLKEVFSRCLSAMPLLIKTPPLNKEAKRWQHLLDLKAEFPVYSSQMGKTNSGDGVKE